MLEIVLILEIGPRGKSGFRPVSTVNKKKKKKKKKKITHAVIMYKSCKENIYIIPVTVY